MENGIVKSFNSKRGYGFVNVKGENRDIIVHYSTIRAKNFKTLKQGQQVYLEYTEQNGKLKAEKVVAICMRKKKN